MPRRTSGTLNNGTTYAAGMVAQAFEFNGQNQNVEISNAPGLNPTTALTVEAWVYLTGSLYQHHDIVSKDGEYSDRQFLLTHSDVNKFRPHVWANGGIRHFDGNTALTPNTWYHVAMTYEQDTLKLYVNGMLDGSNSFSPGGPIVTTTQPVRIGGGAPGGAPPYYFQGFIDEPTVYSRALSSTEISAIYSKGWAGKCKFDGDGDGVTRLQEVFLGLDDTMADKDTDGLSDGDELFVYHTNPSVPDVPATAAPIWWGKTAPLGWTFLPGTNEAIGLAVGREHFLLLRENGSAFAWGDGAFGQTNVPVGLTGVTSVAAGDDHCLALKEDGTVGAWGRNHANQVSGAQGLAGVVAVSAGGDQSLALLSNGTVVQWGQPFSAVPGDLANVATIASGTNFHLALLNNGSVRAWGANTYGQTSVPQGLNGVVAIAAGGAHAMALRTNGVVVAWGCNNSQQTNVPQWYSAARKSLKWEIGCCMVR